MTKQPVFQPKGTKKDYQQADRVQLHYLMLEGELAVRFRNACRGYGVTYTKMAQQMIEFALEHMEKPHD